MINAVAKATFKTFKTEFINDRNFTSLIQLKLELFDYINWYNNIRIYSTLNYLTPIKYQSTNVYQKIVLKSVAIPHKNALIHLNIWNV
ncbi:IS3 family transposase [Spiroplasma ixodetis]|uniref:IS3 family transposase n=1 Tax=Spiroplasma ixodetis TaxID=2141 RepID=UPI003D9C62FA